jgi:exodeoxyribonuclease VII large subunit
VWQSEIRHTTIRNGLYHRRMTDETPLNDPVETPARTGNLREFTVSELSNLLKRTVEDAFAYVRVKGELSRVSRHSSGHCYFDLKDDRSVLSAVVWKGNAARLKVKPEQGLEVVVTGRLTTFQSQSKYQIVVEEMELAGLGALMAMLELRKKKLAAEGLFDPARKKTIPFLPRIVGVVTSPTGAVIRDIMHRLSDRCPRRVLLWPVNVQGEKAAGEIAAAIRGFNALPEGGVIPRPDVLIVARGGGSFEDLLAFSDEAVVRAAAESVIPLISAVGHETDTTLIDFAADRRAPTPTAAAEMAVPVLRDCVETLLALHQRLLRGVARLMERQRRHVQALARALPRADSLFALPRQRFDASSGRLRGALFQNLQRHKARFARASALMRPRIVSAEIQQVRESVADLDARLIRAFRHRVRRAEASLETSSRVLETLSYRAVLARGFVLVRGADDVIKRHASAVKPGNALTLTFADGEVKATGVGAPVIRPPRRGLFKLKGQGDLF